MEADGIGAMTATTPVVQDRPQRWSKMTLAIVGLIVTLVGGAIAIVTFAYRNFETVDVSESKATVRSAAFAEHKAGTHDKTVEDLHKLDSRVLRVEIEHKHRGEQLIWLVSEVKKIGDRVGSKPAPPPEMPDAAGAAREQ